MEFADSQVRPGAETSLRLSASDTSSLCAVSVVDKSIELMGTTSQLTKSQVMMHTLKFPLPAGVGDHNIGIHYSTNACLQGF